MTKPKVHDPQLLTYGFGLLIASPLGFVATQMGGALFLPAGFRPSAAAGWVVSALIFGAGTAFAGLSIGRTDNQRGYEKAIKDLFEDDTRARALPQATRKAVVK